MVSSVPTQNCARISGLLLRARHSVFFAADHAKLVTTRNRRFDLQHKSGIHQYGSVNAREAVGFDFLANSEMETRIR